MNEFAGKSWGDLEVIEHQGSGHLMFTDELRQFSKTGEIKRTKVRVRAARPHELIVARGQTRLLFRDSFKGLDEDRDRDTFAELEQLVILSMAIRTYEPPHAQLAEPLELGQKYDEGCLRAILGRITALRNMLDPRASDLSDDETWDVIHNVARGSTILPLTGIAGHAQPSFLHFMADQAMRSPMGLAWLQSRGISTPGRSESKI